MYTKALLALVPVAAQAAQSARWPVFNLRANVTERYIGYGAQDWDRRDFWHNAPIGESSQGDVTGPLFDDSECGAPVRAGLNDHGPYFQPYFFYSNATSTGKYAPSEVAAGSRYKMKIAQKDQADANGRRAVVMSKCGTGSTSIYISAEEPYHLAYDNKEVEEKFGSFYLCGGGKKGDYYVYGDGLFYRSADETTPEECGEVIFYPECMPLSYTVTTTQGTSEGSIYDGRDQAGHYNATCYVDVAEVAGAPNTDISEWMNAPRTNYHTIGKIDV